MQEQDKNVSQDAQLSDDELKEVAGGKDIQKTRLDQLDSQTKSVDDVQETRLEQLDNQTK